VSEWTVLCDFDGTVAVDDTTDTLLERFGRTGWQALEDDWRAGRIGSRECMAGQVGLLDMDHEQLDAHLAEREIDSAFPAFVGATIESKLKLEILSDGLDYAIHKILSRYALDWLPVISNHLVSVDYREWKLDFPNASATCQVASGTCKCVSAARAQATRKRVLLIGDGASDFCVAEAADFVFAKGKLIAHCLAKNIPHAPIVGFDDALALLPALISGKLIAAPRAPSTLAVVASA
jgi:2-hydroxy-3-keto-5-methylthiopentenyl-1-phosphate phosphatase